MLSNLLKLALQGHTMQYSAPERDKTDIFRGHAFKNFAQKSSINIVRVLLLFLTNLHLTTHNHNVGYSNTNTVPACAVFWPGRAFRRAKLPLKELGSTRRP